jgi:hypothetical protein
LHHAQPASLVEIGLLSRRDTYFLNWSSALPVKTMDEEEAVNPKPEIEESCKPKCIKAWLEYEVRNFSSMFGY